MCIEIIIFQIFQICLEKALVRDYARGYYCLTFNSVAALPIHIMLLLFYEEETR